MEGYVSLSRMIHSQVIDWPFEAERELHQLQIEIKKSCLGVWKEIAVQSAFHSPMVLFNRMVIRQGSFDFDRVIIERGGNSQQKMASYDFFLNHLIPISIV